MRFGVDFGTTTTAIAFVDRGNYPVVSFVNNQDDTVDFIPSVLALDGDRLVYGFDAQDAARDGAPHLRSFKRLLSDQSVTDTSTLRLGNHSIPIIDALTGFLTYAAHQLRTNSSVATVPESEPLEALVGVPAHAWSAQRFLTLEAFRRAGWD
ncbi:MAG: Hsp70 family protein, partial [Pauljensenia sp.]